MVLVYGGGGIMEAEKKEWRVARVAEGGPVTASEEEDMVFMTSIMREGYDNIS